MLWVTTLLLIDTYANSIQDVEHIVIFMQENRAFDHYYGTLKGVRGFNDHASPLLPSGKSMFYQPTHILRPAEYQLPFHVNTSATNAICMAAPAMGYEPDILMWDDGKMNAWNTAREPGYGMSFFDRSDLPYYYTLADNFVIGDQYFQSTFTSTNPNRLHLFSGSNGLSLNHTAVLDDRESKIGLIWETMGETLERAGVSWRVFQEADNFDDNAFAWFTNYKLAKPGNPLFDNGMSRVLDLETAFRDALSNGSLPQVSYMIAPTALSEHATNHPSDGEDLTARLLRALQDHPAMYAKTVFILNYDEGGQFFDHHWTPTPPQHANDGKSTVSTEGEMFRPFGKVLQPPLPIGLGFRVPLIIVSPWTRGNFVISEVFDHTSVIKFIEERFNVTCKNISPWRRAVVGNLLSAFNFSAPDYSWPSFPNTSNYVNTSARECHDLPSPLIPTFQTFPVQESGSRNARPIGYVFLVTFQLITHTTLTLTINNTGNLGAVFYLYDLVEPHNPPLKYTVETGKALTDAISLPTKSNNGGSGSFSFSLHGPNGFTRQFAGPTAGFSFPCPTLTLAYDLQSPALVFSLTNPTSSPLSVQLSDPLYQKTASRMWFIPVGAKTPSTQVWMVDTTEQWYDVLLQGDYFTWRVKGHLENGKVTSTDPAIAFRPAPVLTDPVPMPEHYLQARSYPSSLKDAAFYPYQSKQWRDGEL